MGGNYLVIPTRAAVVGLGASGRSAAAALLDRGCEVRIFDQASTTGAVNIGGSSVEVRCDPDGKQLARQILQWSPQVAVVSPGIPITSAALTELINQDLPLWSEVELAWRLQESSDRRGRPWLCVTGTNGKTTTVGLISAILRAAGDKVAEVGNVGLPISSQVAGDTTVFVVELSSFQLETSCSLEPEAAVCLNVETDHLDWHGNAQAYRKAKSRVYNAVRRARIYFVDDPVVSKMAFDARDAEKSALLPLVTGKPTQGQIGVEDGWIVDRREGTVGERVANLSEIPFFVERARSSALLQDILAAVAIAAVHGASPAAIRKGLADYRPDAHRQELVAETGGIRWVDDSKATNAAAALASLQDLPAKSVVWIAGGETKGQEFGALVSAISDKLRAVILIGADQRPLRRALMNISPSMQIIAVVGEGEPRMWMDHVVESAKAIAHAGDSVILAPACASWDQFKSYVERGEIFAESVRRVTQNVTPDGTFRDG